ncbi:MAG TPA: ATP synthase F1 subunit epsilon [Thermoanaerobaculia bacterium]|nr:ATP synthase F1 subunit epsilon [Thermoanaerobaculia bacterium]
MPGGRLTLTLVTPERSLLDKVSCEEVTLPGARGELGILPAHTPLITLLGVGVVRWAGVDGHGAIAVRGGFAEIAGDVVRVLADMAAAKGAIDAAAAAREKEAAEARRATVSGEAELDAANGEAAYAEARLQVVAGR